MKPAVAVSESATAPRIPPRLNNGLRAGPRCSTPRASVSSATSSLMGVTAAGGRPKPSVLGWPILDGAVACWLGWRPRPPSRVTPG
ncbi:Uncharacterised protein [Mycobacteroides abscessus subsp. abscessus]|nr:Uncharacterised protein [Mycobacteroides abscessus subsp. abscessus]